MATLPSEQDPCPAQQALPKILCIDDDPDISKCLKLRLERHGVEVIRAFDGMQGYWTALSTRPDVIICDMIMPDGEGNYLFTRFRSHALTKDVPIVILTGQYNPAMKRQMLSLGVSAYLTKPINFEELLRELKRILPPGSLAAAEAPANPSAS